MDRWYVGAFLAALGGALIAWGNSCMTDWAGRRSERWLYMLSPLRMLFSVGYLTAIYFLAPLTPWELVPLLCGAVVGLTVPSVFFTVRLVRKAKRETKDGARERGKGENA